MKQFSFNTSPQLRFALQQFEEHRRDILLSAITPKNELKIRWDATIGCIASILALSGYTIAKKDLINALITQKNVREKTQNVLITGIKRALDDMRQNWLATQKPIRFGVIESIVAMVFPKELGLYQRKLRANQEAIRQLLSYMSAQNEHPLERASVGFMNLMAIAPFDTDTMILASLIFHLVLADANYDVRGFLEIETLWERDRHTFTTITQGCIATGDYTKWLEYVAQTAVSNLADIRAKLDQKSEIHHELPAPTFDLNERQAYILGLLEEPDRKISNKDVQKHFKISQITASRDLGKLAGLGLLYSHGKGRSVYYTKV